MIRSYIGGIGNSRNPQEKEEHKFLSTNQNPVIVDEIQTT